MFARISRIDWLLLLFIAPLLIAGLVTMKSFSASGDYFFWRQLLWIGLGVSVFVALANIDWRFLRSGGFLIALYLVGIASLAGLIVFGEDVRGAASWFRFSFFSIEPSEPMKVIFILLMAKYFSRRHIEIANVRHIIVSGIYFLLPAVLIFLQPDFGSAIVFGSIWIGMIMVSGISKRHLAAVFLLGVIVLAVSWGFMLEDYQKLRITTFINPYIDSQGAGYNALQAKIAVGAGGLWGRGIGYGTQSRLAFLPEHETDFIFAAFAEEWGFIGVIFMLLFFGLLLWRMLRIVSSEVGNFEKFFTIGLAIFIVGHVAVHIGMNIGLLPITGIPLPFVSYGGSNLLTLFVALGIWASMVNKQSV